MKKFLISGVCFLLILAFSAFSQIANFSPNAENAVPPPFSLAGKHSLSASVGLIMETNATAEATPQTFSANTGVNNFAGVMRYQYWYRRDWAVNVGVGLLASNASSSYSGFGVSNQSGSVFAVLVGLRYQPEAWAFTPTLRPYLSVAAGPILGYGTYNGAGLFTGSQSFNETAAGTHLGAGIDWFFGRRLFTGFNGGYYLMTDFKRSIAGRKNYSGPDFSFTFGFLFGVSSGK